MDIAKEKVRNGLKNFPDLFEKWVNGAKIQYLCESTLDWVNANQPLWGLDTDYRIKKDEFTPTITGKTVNYFGLRVKVPFEFKWIATSLQGQVMAFSKEPTPCLTFWGSHGEEKGLMFIDPNKHWELSLMEIK